MAERQTRGAQNAEGIARAGSNPAAPTIRRQTAYGRFFISSDRSPARVFFMPGRRKMAATSQKKTLFEDYDGFVEKFKPKKTTELNPGPVYDRRSTEH